MSKASFFYNSHPLYIYIYKHIYKSVYLWSYISSHSPKICMLDELKIQNGLTMNIAKDAGMVLIKKKQTNKQTKILYGVNFILDCLR